MNNNQYQLIILGSGPAGLTAGIYAARSNLNPLIINGPNPGGQLMGTSYVENWPGYKSILGPELMNNLKQQAASLGCSFVDDTVISVAFDKKPFVIQTEHKKTFHAQSIIIATGATSKRLNIPGEQEYWGKGVSTCAVCDGIFFKDKPIIIVGGGDTAMEDASFMAKYTNRITMVHILDKFTASAAMQERVLANKNINIIYNATVTEIKGDGKQINDVIITDQKTKKMSRLPANAVFVAIGLNPNTEIFQNKIALTKSKYIVITEHTKTSVPGVFAAGDVADARYRQAITSAGTGCMAALDADQYLKEVG